MARKQEPWGPEDHQKSLNREAEAFRGADDGPIVEARAEGGPANITVPSTPDPDDNEPYRRWLESTPEKVGEWLLARHRTGPSPLAEIAKLPEKPIKDYRDLPFDLDPHRLDQAGWTIVCRRQDFDRYRHQLLPLLRLREKELRRAVEPLFVERNETFRRFLSRHGEVAGVIQPKKVPYYLTILGSPADIPFEFQYGLSLNHAVGRLHFDKAEDLGRYTRALDQTETRGPAPLSSRALLFSVENDEDRALNLLRQFLVKPLLHDLDGYAPGWSVEALGGSEATRESLAALLGGPAVPGILLFSGHGLEMGAGAAGQLDFQGGLVCRPGSRPSRVFAAEDLAAGADLRGHVSIFFACHGAGTPRVDNFPSSSDPGEIRQLAEKPFIARLPQALLARGASAVVGHVDRGWVLSFVWLQRDREIEAVHSLEDSLKQVLHGHRLGHALRPLARRASSLAAQLSDLQDSLRRGYDVDPALLARYWLAQQDARNFILLGDPAVYAMARKPKETQIRLPSGLAERARLLAEGQGLSLEALLSRLIGEAGPEKTNG